MIDPDVCFECGRPADVQHHVVPRSKGGTRTIPLCSRCHHKAHEVAVTIPHLTAAALARKRSHGERVSGSVPYGYRLADDGVHLVADPAEQRMATRAKELRADGLSLRKIGEQLEAEWLLPRSGGKWHARTVQCLLNVDYERYGLAD